MFQLKGDFGNLSRMVNNVFNGSLMLVLLPFNFSSEMKAAKTPGIVIKINKYAAGVSHQYDLNKAVNT